ncbi:MAG: hypothetical protein IKV38_00600, partial [Clostridia bacterium]|nr:hypothetical protein [Clostridia bacterium]
MSGVWVFLMIASIVKMIFVSPDNVLTVMTESVIASFELGLKLLGAYCVWLGLIEIMRSIGALNAIGSFLSPVTKRLYGALSPKAQEYVSINTSANLIGVANASTPTAVKAIEEMSKGKKTMTKSMAMLFLINSSGLELLPSTVMGMRASAGSSSPSDIFLPCLIVTIVTTALSIFFAWAFFDKDGVGQKQNTCQKKVNL